MSRPTVARGISRKLLGAVSDWARSEGATVLSLGVRTSNPDARAAYLHMGLRPAGTMAGVGDDPDDAIQVMELDLTPPSHGATRSAG